MIEEASYPNDARSRHKTKAEDTVFSLKFGRKHFLHSTIVE